ncbi:MAG: hypothetical protein D6761_04460, partial [Candidatus Dadabacteria bacterium]
GVMGDEPDMVRKLKFGQLQMVGVTVSGIAQLLPEMLVLNLPFLFNNYDEVDYVVGKMKPTFEKIAEDRGLYLFAMLDSGMITAYSKNLVKTADEYIKQRVWIWNADPIAVKLAEVLGVNSVMLPVPEVLTSLQTGLIDTMFSSSTALVALQWQTQMKYWYPITVRYDPAAMVATKKIWDKVSPENRPKFEKLNEELVQEFLRPFILDLRKTEKQIDEDLVREGHVKRVEFDPKSVEAMRKKAMATWQDLAGQLYPQELLDQVLGLLKEYRAAHPAQ